MTKNTVVNEVCSDAAIAQRLRAQRPGLYDTVSRLVKAGEPRDKILTACRRSGATPLLLSMIDQTICHLAEITSPESSPVVRQASGYRSTGGAE